MSDVLGTFSPAESFSFEAVLGFLEGISRASTRTFPSYFPAREVPFPDVFEQKSFLISRKLMLFAAYFACSSCNPQSLGVVWEGERGTFGCVFPEESLSFGGFFEEKIENFYSKNPSRLG